MLKMVLSKIKRASSLLLAVTLILTSIGFNVLATESEKTKLASLTLSTGTLYPEFSADTTVYTAVVSDLSQLPTITAALPSGSTAETVIIQPTAGNNYLGSVVIKEGDDANKYVSYTIAVTTGDKVIPISGSTHFLKGVPVSSFLSGGVTYVPSGAYDSNILTGWKYSSGANDHQHVWELEKTAEISSVRMWVNGHADDRTARYSRIEISEDGSVWSTPQITAGKKGTNALFYFAANTLHGAVDGYTSSYQVDFSEPVLAKYVRLTSNAEIFIREINVLGKEIEIIEPDPEEPQPDEPQEVDITLSNLSLSDGELSPSFSSDVLNYTAELDSFRVLPEIIATPVDSLAIVDVVQPSAYNGFKGCITVTDPENANRYSSYTVQYSPKASVYDITARGDLSFTPWTTAFPVEYGVDRNLSTVTKGQMTPGNMYTVDLGGQKMVSEISIFQSSTQRKDIVKLRYGRIEGSLDGRNFFPISESYRLVPNLEFIDGTLSYCGIVHTLPRSVLTRFIRVVNTATQNDVDSLGAAAAELPISDMLVYGYNISDAFISDEPLNSITRDINPLVDGDLVLGGNEYSVAWSCDSDAIDITTGEITRTKDSQTVNISAVLTSKENPEVVLPQNFTLTLVGDTFVDGVDAFAYESELVMNDVQQQEISIESISSPFVLDIDTLAELEITKDNNQKGNITFKTDSYELLDVAFDGNGFVFNFGDNTSTKWETDAENVKFKFEMFDTTFNLYADTGDGYFIKLYNVAYKQSNRGYINKITFATDGTGDFIVEGIDFDVCGNQLFEEVCKQITFDKLSNEKSLNVTENINLITDIFDGFNIVWSSNSPNLVVPSGTVTIPENSEYITLSVELSYRDETITKNWTVLVGMDNKLQGKNVTSSVAPSGLNYASYVTDADGETSFITSKKEYYLDITLAEVTKLSHFDVFAAETGGSIKSAKVMASEDGKNFTEVWSGELPAGKTSAAITPVKAKVFRISVITTEGLNTGIAEAIAYFAPNDEQKLDADIESVKIPDVLSEGLELPAVGTYGSQITYSSDNSDVKFEKAGDKFVVSVEDVDYDSNVIITCTANSEDGTSKTKTFYVLVYGNLDIRDNKPSGGSMGGGGGSGGGGGGGSSVDYTTEPVAPVQPAPETEKVYTVWDEIGEHWASEEVGYLYQKGIVKGDGKSLNLNGQITRAEFITLLLRAMNIEVAQYNGVFSDVSANDWYSGYIQTAYEKGIMKGDGTNVRPNDLITREEMATILANYLTDSPETESDSTFTDMDSASSWAQENIKKITSLGIINGYEDGSFGPALKLTRAEAMVVFYRMINSQK